MRILTLMAMLVAILSAAARETIEVYNYDLDGNSESSRLQQIAVVQRACIPLAMAEDYAVTDDYSSETGEEDATSDTLYFEILDIKYDYTMEYKNGAWDANGPLWFKVHCKNMPYLRGEYNRFGLPPEDYGNRPWWKVRVVVCDEPIEDEIIEYTSTYDYPYRLAMRLYTSPYPRPSGGGGELCRFVMSDFMSEEDKALLNLDLSDAVDSRKNSITFKNIGAKWLVTTDGSSQIDIDIFNIDGMPIQHINVKDSTYAISPSELPLGMLIIRITGEKETQTFKIFNRP